VNERLEVGGGVCDRGLDADAVQDEQGHDSFAEVLIALVCAIAGAPDGQDLDQGPALGCVVREHVLQ